MIVSLRGTNGAGKSTIVRKIMDLYPVQQKIYRDGRKKPLCMRMTRSGGRDLVVPGHYEIANGGVDTLPTLEDAYDLIKISYEHDADVLYEGKNMSDGPQRLISLHEKGYPVAAVVIRIDTDTAMSSVRKRGHGIKSETVAKLNVKMQRQVDTFGEAGVPVWYLTRAKALTKIRELLGV